MPPYVYKCNRCKLETRTHETIKEDDDTCVCGGTLFLHKVLR